MTKEQKETMIERVARGHVQELLAYHLLYTGSTSGLGGYMACKGHYGSYLTSFANLMTRLEAEGLKIDLIPGERGGMWTAYYKLT